MLVARTRTMIFTLLLLLLLWLMLVWLELGEGVGGRRRMWMTRMLLFMRWVALMMRLMS